MFGYRFAMGVKLIFLVATVLISGAFADNITVDGASRNYQVYAPSGIEKNRPLIIQMHGMNQDASYQRDAAKWEPIADTARFVIVFPNGINKGWDLGGNKDLNFLKALINEMNSKYGIDKNRVYVSGFSMGGMMSYYAATKMSDQIAAIAPVSGYPMGGGTPSGRKNMPIIHTHGTTDDVVNYNGGVSNLKGWVNYEKCSASSQKISPYPSGKNGSAATLEVWSGCEGGSEIRLMSIAGKGHWYSMDLASVNTSVEIWNFVKRFSLDGTASADPAVPVFVEPTNRDSVYNGGFDSTANAWTLQTHGDAKAEGVVKDGKYNIDISAVGAEAYTVQLIQHNIHLEKDQWYEVSFEASANALRSLEVNVEQHEDPWGSYLKEKGNFQIETSAKVYSLKFQMTSATDTNGRLSFNAGTATGKLVLDNISIKKIDAPAELPAENPAENPSDNPETPKIPEETIGISKVEFVVGVSHVYGVYSLSGKFLGRVMAASMNEVRDQVKILTKKTGVYMVKPVNMGSVYKIQVR